MSPEDWDDFDAACFEQHSLEQRRREMDPALFTTPMPPWPRLTPEAQTAVDMAQLKALNFALDRLFK